jgi:TRAP-type C4-dicarboxylate transport system permease small subunit
MKSKIEKLVVSSGMLAIVIPFIASATGTQGTGNFTYTNSIFAKIIALLQSIFGAVFPVVTAGLVLYFAYEIFKFMKEEGADKAIYKGRVVQALAALFIWFTFFGIIQIVAKSFDIGVGDGIQGSTDVTSVNFN